MAIQLARAIGEQRKPISPFEGLADVITKTGENIQAQRALKAEKEQKKQALKDAMASNISVLPIKASPQQQAEYERYVKENLPKLAVLQRSSNVTPAQYQDAVNNFKYGLKDREIKYGEDYSAFEELNKRKEEGTHSVKEYEDFLIGTPDRIQKAEIKKPVTEPTTPEYGKKELGIEYQPSIEESKEEISAPQEKTYTTEEPKAEDKIIKGQQGYFSLPFEEQKKIDTKKVLEEKTTPVMPYMLDAAKGMLGKDYDFSYVRTTDTKKGGKEFDVDMDKLEKDAFYSANMFANPPEIAPNKEFELLNKGIERQAINELLKTHKMVELEQNPNIIAQAKFEIAYDKFKGDAAQKIYQDQLKLREEREKSKKGGMTFNFGQNETKNDTYIPEDSYDTSVPAESMYNNIEYFKQFEKYKKDNATQLSKQFNKYKGEEKEDEFYRRKFNEALDRESELQKGKTVKQNWIEIEKEKLKQYEGSKSISFNNKKEEAVALDVTRDNKSVQRQYIPSRLIYDGKGNIKAVEAYAAVQGADGNYVKKGDSVEIIPMTKRNFDSIRGNFPELLTWSKQNLGIDLKYSQGGAATKPQATKPAATETTEKKSDLKGKKYAGLDANGNPIFK